MELKDFLFTPITIILIYLAAFKLREKFTNQYTYPYFIPGLTVKVIGALLLGLVYQYYYNGGDTFNYFLQSKVLHEAFIANPLIGLKLLFADGTYLPSTFEYTTRIYWFRSPSEYFIVKAAAILGFFNSHSYSSIAVLFATLGFSGVWALFHTFVKIAPRQHLPLAICILFVPSVFFWGSGLMKDTITLGALGWLFYGVYTTLIEKKISVLSILSMVVPFYIIFKVKLYILLSFLPPLIFWIFLENSRYFNRSLPLMIIKPFIILLGASLAYLAAINVTQGDIRYDISRIGERTKINAEYLYRISLLQDGSAYYLGELDGTINSMFKIAPQAINVTLFRPYPWEIANPLMLLSAVESFLFSLFLISLLFKPGLIQSFRIITSQPLVMFCIGFTLILAFAVGLNSYNFGTLVRYKIQMLPFYLAGIVLIKHYGKLKHATYTTIEQHQYGGVT